MLWEVYTRSAWQAVADSRLEEAGKLFGLAQQETQDDACLVESDLGLAVCSHRDPPLFHASLEACRDRLGRCTPAAGIPFADHLAGLLPKASDPYAHRLIIDALRLLPFAPSRFQADNCWPDLKRTLETRGRSHQWLEEVGCALRWGANVPDEEAEGILLELLQQRRQWGELSELADVILVMVEFSRTLPPVAACRMVLRWSDRVQRLGLMALADDLWNESLRRGAVGSARVSRWLQRRLERTNFESTSQAALAGLRSLPKEQQERVGRSWILFWLKATESRLNALVPIFSRHQPKSQRWKLMLTLGQRALQNGNWDLVEQSLQALQEKMPDDPADRCSIFRLGVQLERARPDGDVQIWLEKLVEALPSGDPGLLEERRALARLQTDAVRAEAIWRAVLEQLQSTGRGLSLEAAESWAALAESCHRQGQSEAAAGSAGACLENLEQQPELTFEAVQPTADSVRAFLEPAAQDRLNAYLQKLQESTLLGAEHPEGLELLGPAPSSQGDYYQEQAQALEQGALQQARQGHHEDALRTLVHSHGLRLQSQPEGGQGSWNNELLQATLLRERGRLVEARRLLDALPPGLRQHSSLWGRTLTQMALLHCQQGEPYGELVSQAQIAFIGQPRCAEQALLGLLAAELALQEEQPVSARPYFRLASQFVGQLAAFADGLYHWVAGQLEEEPARALENWRQAEAAWSLRWLGPVFGLNPLRWRIVEAIERGEDVSRSFEDFLSRLRQDLNEKEPDFRQQRLRLTRLLMKAAQEGSRYQAVLDYAQEAFDSLADGEFHPEILALAGHSAARLGQWEKAAELYTRLSEGVDPHQDSALYLDSLKKAVFCLENCGRRRQAWPLRDQILAASGGDRLSRAHSLTQAGHWELAVYVLQQAPADEKSDHLLARLHLDLENPQAARELTSFAWETALQLGHLEKALVLAPDPLARARCLHAQGQSLAAAQLAEPLLASTVGAARVELLVLLGEAASEPNLEWLEQAVEASQGLGKLAPARPLLALGRARRRAGQLAAALESLGQAHKLRLECLGRSQNLTIRSALELAEALAEADRSEAARALLEPAYQAARQEPEQDPSLLQGCRVLLARLALLQGAWSEAETFLLQQEVLDLSGVQDLARSQAAQGRLQDGADCLLQAVARHPREASYPIALADFWLWHGRPEEAGQVLQELVLQRHPAALVQQARVHLECAQLEPAAALLEGAPPGVVTAEWKLAQHRAAEAAAELARCLEEALERPERVRAGYALARALADLGKPKEAVSVLEKARRCLGKEACWQAVRLDMLAGRLKQALNAMASAAGHYQQAVDLAVRLDGPKDPRLAPLYLELGEFLTSQGQDQAAETVLQKVLDLPELAAQNPDQQRALALLMKAYKQRRRFAEADELQRRFSPAPAKQERALLTQQVSESKAPLRPAVEAARPAAVRPKFRRVAFRELVTFARQFHTLLVSGVSLIQALESCQHAGTRLEPVLQALQKQILAGQSLSAAVSQYQSIFGRELATLFLVAEKSGRLVNILERWAIDLEAREQRRMRLQGALFYPCLVLASCTLAIAVLLVVFVPIIKSTLTQSNLPLPLPTQILVAVSDAVRNPLLLFGLPALLAALAAGAYHVVRPEWDKWKGRLQDGLLDLPVVGRVLRLGLFSAYFHSFASLMDGGIRLDLAVEMAGHSITAPRVQRELSECKRLLLDGEGIGEAFQSIRSAPPFTFQFVAVGMDTGRLPQMSRVVSSTLDMDFELAADALKTLVEPLLLFLTGLLTCFVVVAAMAPTLSLINAL